MRRLSFVILALLPLAAGAQKKPRSSAEQALIDINTTLISALATGDAASLTPLLAGDLVYTDPSGAAQSRAQLLSAIAGGYRVQTSAPEITRVHIDGNLGLLDFQSKMAGAGGDSALVKWSSVYVLRAGQWQLTSLHSTGAPVQPPRSAPTPAIVVRPALPIPVTSPIRTPTTDMDRRMTARATGTFQVETKPITPYNTSTGAGVGRFSIDKQYQGEIEGTGKGEMLSAGNPASGSAGYVAIERVTATLRGKKGSFALQHAGTMDSGALSLSISVVPASGTGDLAGITGTMSIINESGKHSYVFDYSLPKGQ